MSVQILTQQPAYYLTPGDYEKQMPISSMELASLKKNNNPKYLGLVVAKDLGLDESLLAEIMAKGNEFLFAGDQVIWEEEATGFNSNIISGVGVVSFANATGTFTINNTAIPVDPYDFNSERPTEAKWLQVKQGMEFSAFDTSGRRVNGKITSIASDKKSFVATPIGGSWRNLGATDITIAFLGNNLDHCKLAPCIGFENYMPARQNTMFKDSECLVYCEETEIANSPDGVDAQPLLTQIGNDYWNIDSRLDQKHTLLSERADNVLALGEQLTEAEAGGGARGTMGILPILENRATKFFGKIETKTDITNLAANMRAKGIKKASLRVSSEQYSLLLAILDDTKYSFDPFVDHTSALFSIGFAGFRIGDVEIHFKQWMALDRYPNIGKRYHWILIPEGRLTVKFNKRVTTAAYLNIGWFGKPGDVYKYKRVDDKKKNGDVEIDIINKFMPIVLRPEDWFLGFTIAT